MTQRLLYLAAAAVFVGAVLFAVLLPSKTILPAYRPGQLVLPPAGPGQEIRYPVDHRLPVRIAIGFGGLALAAGIAAAGSRVRD